MPDIESSKRVVRRHRRHAYLEPSYESGELLTMTNGEEWFHPYSGDAPVQEK